MIGPKYKKENTMILKILWKWLDINIDIQENFILNINVHYKYVNLKDGLIKIIGMMKIYRYIQMELITSKSAINN